MYSVKIFASAFLIQLTFAINLEFFLNSSGRIDYDFACCFNRFEQTFSKHRIKQRSVKIFLLEPDKSVNSQLTNILIPKSSQIYPCSVEVWQPKKCLLNHECRSSIQSENSYIFVQSDDQTTGVQFKDSSSVWLQKIIDNIARSSNLCIVHSIQNKHGEISVRAEGNDDGHCSLLNMKLNTNTNFRKPKMTSLNVAGIVSKPFVYYDAANGNLKGFDVSLMNAVAKKLETPMFVHVIEASPWAVGSIANR